MHVLAAVLLLSAAAPAPGQDPSAPEPIGTQVAPRLSGSAARTPARPVVLASGETLTADPRAYREWLRRKVDEDLAELYKATSDLLTLFDPASPGDAHRAAKQADRVVKLSHDVWNNLQMRKPTRERPKRDPNAQPRALAAARADAEAARALVREIAEGVAAEQRSRAFDASRRVATLEKLERVERLGLQLKVDAEAHR